MIRTYGWFPVGEVAEKCAVCVFKLQEGKMVACEKYMPRFPAALKCQEFTDVEAVEV